MAHGTLGDAMQVMAGKLLAGDPATRWSGAAIDSRKVSGGELFFALPGDRTDGHRFVGQALERGAAAAIVHQPIDVSGTGSLVLVDDSLRALHALTSDVRSRLPEHLVAVTGSAGKTTTKDLLALMLAERYRVASNPGSLNNLYGFPLALLGIPDDTEWMVAEMGMSTPGELSQLARMGRPEIVVFTNVRPAHLESFGSLSRIAEAKAELLEGLDANGLVIANAEDPEVMRVSARHQGRIVSFGLSAGADHRARDIEITEDGSSRFTWVVGDREQRVHLPLLGEHNVANFLAAAACAYEVGIDCERIAASMLTATPAAGRSEIHRRGGATIVDDSYNSNPAALSASLASASKLDGRRHWAVLGDMLELGDGAENFHLEAGRQAVALGFSLVLAVGELSRSLARAFEEGGGEARWFATAEEVTGEAVAELAVGDVLLVKGSRGVGLDVVVRALLNEEAA